MIRFKFLTGDINPIIYGAKWMSNPQSNGEFTYYFVIELMNWVEAVGERDAPEEKYNVSLSIVSPEQAGEENMLRAFEGYGDDDDDVVKTPAMQVEALHQYAGGVNVWNQNGNNWQSLMRKAKKQAKQTEFLFGFVMDKPVNRLGETGWEQLKLTPISKLGTMIALEAELATSSIQSSSFQGRSW